MNNGKLNKKRVEAVFANCRSMAEDAIDAWQMRKAPRAAEALNFFRGAQYRAYANELDLDEEAEVVNICRRFVTSAVAELLAQIPAPKIPASRGDMAAQSRAKMTENLAQSFARNGILSQFELREAATWAYITGGGWIKSYFDIDRGKHRPSVDYTGLESETSEEQPDFIQLFEGAPAIEFVSTADGLPDPSAQSPDEMRYFVHRKLRPVSELEDRIVVDWEGKPTRGRFDASGSRIDDTRTKAALDDFGYNNFTNGGRNESTSNTLAELVEFWHQPTAEFPYGLFLVWSGPTLISIGPNPFTPVRLPFTLVLGPNKPPDTLYADGLLADIIGPQRVLNRMETKKLEILDKMANPHLLVPFNSGIEDNVWGNKPGQVIGYNVGHAPSKLEPAEIPQSMFAHAAQTFENAKFVTGYSDLAAGNVGASTAGRTVAFASENAEKARAPDISAWRNALIDVMKQLVYVAHQFFDEGKLVRVLGPTDELETREFFSDEYDFDNEFAPEPYNDEPKTHAARIAMALELQGGAFFADTPDAERMRRLVGGSYARKSAYDPHQADRDRALREQLAILRNFLDVPSVQLYDTHAVHLEEHNEWRKSVEYEQLPEMSRQAFDDHCEVHEMLENAAKTGMEGTGGERENRLGPPPLGGEAAGGGANVPGAPTGPGTPGREGVGPDSGVSPPPSIGQFNAMSESEQRGSDQA